MKNRREPCSREEREKILQDLESSGLSVSEFARQRGLTRTLLSVWRLRYRSGTTLEPGSLVAQTPLVSSGSAVTFQEVNLAQALGQNWAAEIILPQGATVRLDQQGRQELLRHLFQSGLC